MNKLQLHAVVRTNLIEPHEWNMGMGALYDSISVKYKPENLIQKSEGGSSWEGGRRTRRGNGNVLVIGLGADYVGKFSLGTWTKAYTYTHFLVCIWQFSKKSPKIPKLGNDSCAKPTHPQRRLQWRAGLNARRATVRLGPSLHPGNLQSPHFPFKSTMLWRHELQLQPWNVQLSKV